MDSLCFLCHGPTDSDSEEQNGVCVEDEGGPCVHCAQLQELDLQANEVKEELKRILHRRSELRTARNCRHDLLISRLPLELTTQILIHCFPPIPTIDSFGRRPRPFIGPDFTIRLLPRPQFILGAVCRAWRRILWTDPRFWNVLDIVLTQSSPLFVGDMIKEWVARSGGLPLYIYLLYINSKMTYEVQHKRTIDTHALLQSVVVTLSSCASRWSLVELGLPATSMSQLRCDPSVAVGARGLSLMLTSAYPASDEAELPLRFDGSFDLSVIPRPERLHLTGLDLANVSMDWSCVTHFDSQFLYLHECIEVLRSAPLLTHFFVHYVALRRQPLPLPSSPIVHNSIQNLRFPACCPETWDLITCPNVLDLTVGGSSHASPVCPNLERFILRSSYSLRCLSLNDVEEAELIELLKLLPKLQHLDLGHTGALIDPFFQYLGETTYRDKDTAEQDTFLPRLEKFTFAGERAFSWPSVPLLSPPKQPGKLRRPLNQIVLTVAWTVEGEPLPNWREPFQHPEDVGFIDLASLEKILLCIEDGVDIRIEDFEQINIIELCKAFYRTIEEESKR